MLSARYGRMKVGRCVEVEPGFESMLEDPRYLGCSTDVLDVVSRHCTGRSECQMRVTDQTFGNVNSCYTSLKMYLEVAYMCINGEILLLLQYVGLPPRGFLQANICCTGMIRDFCVSIKMIMTTFEYNFLFIFFPMTQHFFDKIGPNQLNKFGFDKIRDMKMTYVANATNSSMQ